MRGRRAHTRHLVGGDGGSHTGPTDEHTAVGPPLGDRSCHPEGDLRVGDVRSGQVDDVAHTHVLDQSLLNSVLQKGSVARGTNGDSHNPSVSGHAAQGEPQEVPYDSTTLRHVEVILDLQVQPELRRCPEVRAEPQRRVRSLRARHTDTAPGSGE